MKSQGFCCWSEQSLQQWPRLLQKCSWNYRRWTLLKHPEINALPLYFPKVPWYCTIDESNRISHQAGWVTPTTSTIWAPSNFDTYTWADREVGFHPHAIYKSGERQFCAKFNRGTCTSAPFCFRWNLSPVFFQMYKHHAELIFSGPLMGSPTCSTTDVLLSWACLTEQQVCVEELTLGSIIPRGVFLPGVEGVLRRAWYRPMIQSQKQQQQMYTVSPLTQVTRTWLPRDIVSYASSMRIKKPFLYLFSALVYHKPTKQSVIM